MTTFFNVFEHRDGEQHFGAAHADRQSAIDVAGSPRRWHFGVRPVYRLRVTLKDRRQ